MNPPLTIVTHSGSFHSDDVFAVASLLLLLEKKNSEVHIVRSREDEVIAKGDFVVDVGAVYDVARNRFDHHQPGTAGTRANGVPYAAFGLVWKTYGEEIAGSAKIAELVDVSLVQPIDYGDNNGLSLTELAPDIYLYTIDRLVGVFGSTYEEKDRKEDEVFLGLVAFAQKVLVREIAKASAVEHARGAVEKAYEEATDKRLIVLEAEYPWYTVLSEFKEPLFVVFPDGKSGNWGNSAVRRGLYDFTNRKDFPRAWAGKRDAELARLSGVPDAVFCHNRLFFAVAKSREGAVALAKKALEV